MSIDFQTRLSTLLLLESCLGDLETLEAVVETVFVDS
jgi:hypothetical protein